LALSAAGAGAEPAIDAPAAAPEGHRITLAQGAGRAPVTLYYEEHGSGPPLLLLHGLGESTFTWHDVLPALAARHRVIALDLKGFGRSDKPDDGAYGADDQGALVARFILDRSLDRLTLVGHSFGGTVALRTMLAKDPGAGERIARIAVIGAPALPRATARHLDLVKTPIIPDALASSLSPETLARLLLREAMGGPDNVREDDVAGYAAPYSDAAALRAFFVTARTIVNERNAQTIARRYRSIDVPVLALWCRDDPIVPLKAGRRLVAALPRAKLTVLEGCHHLPQHEKPEALARMLTTFAGTGRFP